MKIVRRHSRFRPRRGIFLAEAIVGTMLAAGVMTIVIIAVSTQRRIAIRMADERDATRACQNALLDLQCGRPSPGGVVMHAVNDTAAPAGWHWAAVEQRHVVLLGLVPDGKGAKP